MRALAAAPVLALLLLGACTGFRPMYATGGVAPALAHTEVQMPEGRTGFYLHQALTDQLALERDEAPRYRLRLELDEDRYERGLRIDNVASSYEVALQVNYELLDAATGARVTAGTVRPLVTYASADQPYAAVTANLDAAERAANEAARMIRLELARHFAEQAARR